MSELHRVIGRRYMQKKIERRRLREEMELAGAGEGTRERAVRGGTNQSRVY